MTIKLTMLEPRVPPSVTEQKGAAQTAAEAPSKNVAANSVPSTASSAPREVALTEAGRQLAAWLREDHGSAGVDEAKVARLRVEIEHGTYRLDSTRIAEGLLTSEKDLLRMMDRG